MPAGVEGLWRMKVMMMILLPVDGCMTERSDEPARKNTKKQNRGDFRAKMFLFQL